MAESPKQSTDSKTDSKHSVSPGAEEQTKHGDTVLIAMDGSEYSDYALQFYMDSVHKPGNNVILVHSTEYKCVSYPAVAMMSGNPDMSMVTKEIKAEEAKGQELVEKLTQKMNDMKIDVTIQRIHGEPGPAILTVAREKHADFIVIGSRGKGSVRRTFTGSVTDYVSHHSPVPVMVARHKDHLKHHHHHHHGFHFHNPFHHHKKHEESKASS